MVNLKKPEKEADTDILCTPTRTAYPEYEELIAEEIMPQRVREIPEEKAFMSEPTENDVPVKIQAAEPFGAAMPAKAASAGKNAAVSVAANQNTYLLTSAEERQLKIYLGKRRKEASNNQSAVMMILAAIVFVIVFLNLTLGKNSVVFATAFLTSLIFNILRNRQLKVFDVIKKKINDRNYRVCIKRIECFYPDEIIGFTDGSKGKCIGIKTLASMQKGDMVRVADFFDKQTPFAQKSKEMTSFVFKL